MVKREAPATPLQEIQKHAAEFQKTFGEQLNALVSSKNTQEWQKALKDGSDTVLTQVNSLIGSVQSAVSTHLFLVTRMLLCSQKRFRT